ncbi:MAG: DUF4037 domain-containing protein [Oscillospiraceae bacterium]|nr:DUF4037 domain-containing protein [Oscillospiraceae bacterium]
MNGLELSRAFFEQCGRPMLEQRFPSLLPFLAVGLCGSGSECFGYDDELSRDHDFEPGFCIFLPEEAVVDRRSEFLLERAYASLPGEFRGFPRAKLLPVGGARHGVFRTEDFFLSRVGSGNGLLSAQQWLTLPAQALAEATNGELFLDNWGEVSRIRRALAQYPEPVRLKKLAGQLLLMAQSGPYNHARCLARGETAAARLAACEFARSAMAAIFLLNRRYMPYYKWSFRALRELPKLAELASELEALLSSGTDTEERIAVVCAAVLAEVRAQGLSAAPGDDPERHAYAVNDRIADASLRNLHILAGV